MLSSEKSNPSAAYALSNLACSLLPATRRATIAAALLDGELRHRGEILPVQLHRCAQVQRVGPRLGDDAVGHPLHPGHDQAVPEADEQLHAHRDVTTQPLHDAHELRGAAIARRHEVDDPRRAVGGLEVGLQD